MVAVFASFILNGDPTVKQFGVGLAVAVAIDATIVRCVLVPAVMVLLGRANWWFPAWLERHMPHVGIEGEEFFEELDAKSAAPGPGWRPMAGEEREGGGRRGRQGEAQAEAEGEAGRSRRRSRSRRS